DVLGVGFRVHARVHKLYRLAGERERGRIAAAQPDRAMAVVAHLAFRYVVVDQPGAAVVVEEQRGIDAVEFEPGRIRPRPGRIVGGDDEVAHAAAGAVE